MVGARPTYVTGRTPGRLSYGGPTADLAESIGTPFIPWQRELTEGALEVLPETGRYAFDTVIVSGPRQIGKTVAVRAVNTKKIAQGRRVFTTAQTRKHAARRWNDATSGVELTLNGTRRQRRTITADMVVKRNTGVDHECLTWLASGGTWEPFAPNEDGVHGESPDDVHVDECYSLSPAQAEIVQAGYTPAMSARPDPQEWLTSTQGDAKSVWWATVCAAGRQAAELGLRTGTFYLEYSVPLAVDGVSIYEVPDDVLLDVIWAHHPGDGFLLNRDVVARDLRKVHEGTKTRAEFLRGYGNLRNGGADVAGAWPALVWDSAKTDLAPVGDVGLGIDVDPDGREWALVAAGRAEAGERRVWEVIERRDGTPGPAEVALVKAVVEKQRPVATYVIGSGASLDFADSLEQVGVATEKISRANLAAAVSRSRKSVSSKRLLHRDQPSLNDAVKAATLRESSDHRYWARLDHRPIATLQAATLAEWALDHPSDAVTGPFKIHFPGRRSA